MPIPPNWTVEAEKVSPYVFRITALATDGRKIEATGADEAYLRSEVLSAILEFEKHRQKESE